MALQFVTKQLANSNKDILITILNSDKSKGKEQDIVRIRFANETDKLIGDTEYIMMAVTDTRLYFAATDCMKGWKITKRPNTEAAVCCKSPALVGWAINGGTGEYDLKFDQKEQLYFVENEVLKFQQRLR